MPQPAPEKQARKKPKTAIGMVVLAAVAASAALASLMMPLSDSGHDIVSAKVRMAAFKQAGKTLELPPVPLQERELAIKTMNLPEARARELRQQIEDGKTDIAWIDLWDDQAEDGDVIRVTSGGVSVDVSLHNQPVRLAVPVAPLSITGMVDGGGGITAGVRSSSGSIGTPVMQPGQTIIIGVRQ